MLCINHQPASNADVKEWGGRWENDIKMDHQEVGWGRTDWIYLTQDRNSWPTLVNAIINHQGPKNLGNFMTEDLLYSVEGLCSKELVRWLVGAVWLAAVCQ